MKNIGAATALITLAFAIACNTGPDDEHEPADIGALTRAVSILGSSGEDVDTIAVAETVTLTLEIANDTVEDIGITYDHCTPYCFTIGQGDDVIWGTPAADCTFYRSEIIASGNALVFQEEWTAVQWNPDEQQYFNLPPGTYTFRAWFSGFSAIDADSLLTVDESVEFSLAE